MQQKSLSRKLLTKVLSVYFVLTFVVTLGQIVAEYFNTKNHINGIEDFWNQAKRYMRKFNGVPKAHFGLFLKKCEWRFNNSDPSAQLSQLRQWVRRYLN